MAVTKKHYRLLLKVDAQYLMYAKNKYSIK